MAKTTREFPSRWSVYLRLGLLVALQFLIVLVFKNRNRIEISDQFSEWSDELNLALDLMIGGAFMAVPGLLLVGTVLPVRWPAARVLGGIAGMAILMYASYRLLPDKRPYLVDLMIVSFALGTGLAICLLLRVAGVVVAPVSQSARQAPTPRLRFTLAQLMAFTAVASVAIGALSAVSRLLNTGSMFELFVDLSIALPVAWIGLVQTALAAWAALGPGRALPRVGLALVAIVLAGLPLNIICPDWLFWYWPTLMFVTGVSSLLTLLVVRSCGVRLVRQSSHQPAAMPHAPSSTATGQQSSHAA